MNDNLSVIIQAVLEKSGVTKELSEIQKIVDKNLIEIKPKLETASLKNNLKEVSNLIADSINKAYKNVGNIDFKVTGNDVFKILNQVEKQAESTAQKVNRIQLQWGDGSYEAKYDSLIAKTRQWTDANDESVISTQKLTQAYNEFNMAASNFAKDGSVTNRDLLIQKEEELGRQLKATTNDIKIQNAEWAKSSSVNSLHQKVQEFYDKNSATHRRWGEQLKRILSETSNGAQITRVRLNEIEQEFIAIGNEARRSGKLGQSFFGGLKDQASKFVQWFSVTSVVMEGVQSIKKMISNVKELDDSLLELSKVSDLSADGLSKITEEAYKLGETVGKTGRQVIDAVTEFKRAGYELNDSMDMAEAALVMTNVAEGIDDTADAAGTLISVLKGYNMAESQAMSIVDKMNQASNLNPIGFDQIAEGLERTAGTMAQSGTTIDQTIGLITAGYAQLRNVEKVSTGLITLSARLRGVGEDGEVIDGLSATLQEDFGKIGVAIEDADGNLRSIYEIAQDYAKVLPTLTSKQKQYYAELAAGKRQVTVWNAITQQFQDAEKATADSVDSLNSASVENQKYLDSISGKVSQFNSAVEQLSSTVVDSNLVKFFVDLGTTGVKAIDGIVNSLGGLGTIGLLTGAGLSIKNIGRPKMFGLVLKYADNYKCSLGY